MIPFDPDRHTDAADLLAGRIAELDLPQAHALLAYLAGYMLAGDTAAQVWLAESFDAIESRRPPRSRA